MKKKLLFVVTLTMISLIHTINSKKNVINSFNYELQNTEPNIVTKFTRKCINHVLSNKTKKVSTLKMISCDCYTLLYNFNFLVSSSQTNEFYFSRIIK